jgi:hypothetical protein
MLKQGFIPLAVNAEDPVCIFIYPVKTQFIGHIKQDQQTSANSSSKAKNIGHGKTFDFP